MAIPLLTLMFAKIIVPLVFYGAGSGDFSHIPGVHSEHRRGRMLLVCPWPLRRHDASRHVMCAMVGCHIWLSRHVNAPDIPHFWHKKSPKGVAFLLKQFESDVIIFLGNPGPTFWWLKRLRDGPNPRHYRKVTTILAWFYLSIFLRGAKSLLDTHTLKVLKTEARSISFGRVFSCRSRRRWQSVQKTSSGRWWCLVQARPPQERIGQPDSPIG